MLQKMMRQDTDLSTVPIIVCKDVGKDVIVSLLSQIGWRSHIQSVVSETDLVNWYEKALRGQYSELLADKLLYVLLKKLQKSSPPSITHQILLKCVNMKM